MLASRSFRFLGLGLLVLSMSGFGCKEPAARTVPASLFENSQLSAFSTPNDEPPAPIYKSRGLPERGIPAEIVEMRQTLRNLGKANQYRASMRIPTPQGIAKGELEFVRGQGFRGMLSINDQFISELYKIKGQIYFRHGTSTWANMTQDDEAKTAASGFEQALAFSTEATSSLRDSARITKTEQDTALSCKAYEFWQINTNSEKDSFRFCLQNGYPISIKKMTSDGDIEIAYRDFDKPIILTVPTLGTTTSTSSP